MFSNPLHNLAAAALIATIVHDPGTMYLILRITLVSKNFLLPSAAVSVGWNCVR